jgi:hypothetical protein
VTHANIDALYGRISVSVDRAVLLFFCSLMPIVLLKRKKLNVRSFSIMVSAIVLTDLYLFGTQFIKTSEFVASPTKQSIVGQLKRNPVQGRVATISPLFNANDGLRYGFPSVSGYDPLILRRYVYYTQSSQNYQHDDHVVNLGYINVPGSKLIKMLNVNQTIVGEYVQNIDNVLSYTNIVNNAVIKPSDEILDFMKKDEFDPLNMVVLEPEYGYKLFPKKQSERFKASSTVTNYDNENIKIRTSSNEPGYLVLSEIFYPGWQATVDGKKASILRGNYMLRVLALERGEHEVHLYFVSWPFRIGAFVSLMTLVFSLWFVMRRRKKDPVPDTS